MSSERMLIDFSNETIDGWKLLSDKIIGGKSLGEWYIENGKGL